MELGRYRYWDELENMQHQSPLPTKSRLLIPANTVAASDFGHGTPATCRLRPGNFQPSLATHMDADGS
jgi:hypothetical protein